MIQNNYYSKGKTKVRYNTNLQHACKLIIIHGILEGRGALGVHLDRLTLCPLELHMTQNLRF